MKGAVEASRSGFGEVVGDDGGNDVMPSASSWLSAISYVARRSLALGAVVVLTKKVVRAGRGEGAASAVDET